MTTPRRERHVLAQMGFAAGAAFSTLIYLGLTEGLTQRTLVAAGVAAVLLFVTIIQAERGA